MPCVYLRLQICVVDPVQSLKLAVSPHFEINISVPGNMITPCEGNMSAVLHRGIIFDYCKRILIESLLS
jgi:hypothetical protein